MVFLDRASLKAKVRKPLDADEYMEYDKTAANELASRLERATVAIANKVPMLPVVFDNVTIGKKGLEGVEAPMLAVRSAAIESSLRRATEVPLACARACAAVIALTQSAADLGYKGVVSDAGVAVLAAFAGAALNVYINAAMLRDRIFTNQSMAEIDRLVASAAADSETVYTTVRGRL